MLDVTRYLITQNDPGGPQCVEQIQLDPAPLVFASDLPVDDRPSSAGQRIGGLVSLALMAAVGAYLVIAI